MTKKLLVTLVLLAFGMLFAENEGYTVLDLSGLPSARAIAGTTASNVPKEYTPRSPVYAFNGAGLTDGKHIASAADKTMFMNNVSNEGAFPWYIQVDLGEAKRLDAVRIWNFNFSKKDPNNGNTPCTLRGVRNYRLYVSDAATWSKSVAEIEANYTCVSEGVLAQASGTDAEAGELVELDRPVAARFVALVALDDFDERVSLMRFNGIAEIQLLQKSAEMPEPVPPAFASGDGVLIEAESFSVKGGWAVDPQFADVMGSPYLLAHGRGVPVANAATSVSFASNGWVRAWVRTRDWTPDWDGEKPGRFRLLLDGEAFPRTLGVNPPDWGWADAGVLNVTGGRHELALRDLTGFEGRCDAVYLTADTAAPPNEAAELAAWRAKLKSESAAPADVVTADLVVVGGGIAGTAAAIAAADAGLSVAIVQDRPVLGGNASDEIRVRTEKEGHEFHWIVKAIRNNVVNGQPMAADDANRMAVVAGYPSIATHLGWRAYGVVTNRLRKIVAVDARHVETGARRRFVAPLYCDTTGDGWLGYWAGAAYHHGREAKGEYDEPTHAQDVADTSTMGSSLLWTTKTADEPVAFPSVPWATKVSGTRASTSGDWTWEAGLGTDENTIWDAEMLRDRMFRAIYGSFSNAKAKAGNERLVFDFFGHIAGHRESRRIIGDYVVSERDVTETRQFEDAIGLATWSIDLHRYNGNSGFLATTTHHYVDPWWMPYRSLCCRDVPNLFLAGRCASYSHVAFGSSRVMHAGAQQGVAVGYAAALCKKYACRPREIYQDAKKTGELQKLINKRNEYAFPPCEAPSEREVVSVIVDNADAKGVEISGAWPASSFNSDRYGADYLHNNKQAADNLYVRYTPDLPSNALYRVSLFWNGDPSRSDKVPVEVVYDGGVETKLVNMQVKSSRWNEIGVWPFKAGISGSVRILTKGQKNLTVIADAVKFSVVEKLERLDSDGNGLPDAWERRHFLRMTGTDPDGDPDGDGRTNLEEYERGTDPNRPNQPLVVSITRN